MSKNIVEKLNLIKYKNVVVLNMPQGEDHLVGLVEYDTSLQKQAYDLIFAFVLDMTQLQQLVQQILATNKLAQGGYLYVAYPKKGNKVYETYIHRDDLFVGLGAGEDGYIGESSVKFSRMVGMNDIFTVIGLKEDAKGKNIATSKPSQSVDDYISFIPDIEQYLQGTPQLLTMYQALTPGYRKDWARYVYSAKQNATKEKRREEMKMIIGLGYKSRELYMRERR